MNISGVLRVLMLSLLLIILAGLCYYYTSEYENHLEFQSYETIQSSNYPINQVVYVKGSIIEIEPDGYYIFNRYKNQDVIFKVLGPASGEFNDETEILGVLGPSYQILSVNKIRVISFWKYQFELLRSFLALIFLLIIFLKYWQIDFKKLTFQRR